MLISGGRRMVPAETTVSPLRTSSPRKRICCGGLTLSLSRTASSVGSVSSIGTTASQPGGMGAPVMIRTAQPGSIAGVAAPPAGI